MPALVVAFDAVAGEHAGLRLVLAGPAGWGTAELAGAIGAAADGERVKRLGYVDAALVPALLRRAAVVAYPSFYEGFGLPALEALACGAPLVTSASTAMAEFAGPAAILVDPTDPSALAAGLAAALGGGPAADDRRREGLVRAARFTWERSAAGHVAAFRAAAGQG